MNSSQYKRMLIAKAKELRLSQISKDQISIERNPELLDEIQRTADRELALDSLTRHWQTSALVTEALERIASHEYGVCAQCEEPIGDRRLKAIPWAKFCIHCQEQQDRKTESPVFAQAA